jgi:hypothetical protein
MLTIALSVAWLAIAGIMLLVKDQYRVTEK